MPYENFTSTYAQQKAIRELKSRDDIIEYQKKKIDCVRLEQEKFDAERGSPIPASQFGVGVKTAQETGIGWDFLDDDMNKWVKRSLIFARGEKETRNYCMEKGNERCQCICALEGGTISCDEYISSER